MNYIDSKKALESDSSKIIKKTFLKNIYINFYKRIKPRKVPNGKVVELGSGAGFIKKIIPNIITSDVIDGPGIDKIFFAEKMPFKKESVSAFLMIDVFHHIKDVKKALLEMERCLKRKGKIIMIEPWNSFWGHIIYKYLHHEHFDPNAAWRVKGKGRMSDSNTALPWIVFSRDREKFEKEFPNLEIVKVEPHTPFLYLLSGGLTKWQFLPNSLYPLAVKFERLISPLNRFIGMFVTVELRKVK